MGFPSYCRGSVEEVAWIVPSLPFTWTVFVGTATFFSLSAADPERMASSIASLAKAGFTGVLALGYAIALGFPWGKAGGGGGSAIMGAGGCCGGRGGGGVEAGGDVQVKEGGEDEGE